MTTSVPTGHLFLAPLVAEFVRAYPAVEVAVHLTDRSVDLVAERFDVAVRMGQPTASGSSGHAAAKKSGPRPCANTGHG